MDVILEAFEELALSLLGAEGELSTSVQSIGHSEEA
jgi:hypothetical protein